MTTKTKQTPVTEPKVGRLFTLSNTEMKLLKEGKGYVTLEFKGLNLGRHKGTVTK